MSALRLFVSVSRWPKWNSDSRKSARSAGSSESLLEFSGEPVGEFSYGFCDFVSSGTIGLGWIFEFRFFEVSFAGQHSQQF